ncbi:MAG: membrane protease YdiL (CAAX protease family) [Planctomycetota bacterium]|jgi:membrane protease YdiL (CAAX protease family)
MKSGARFCVKCGYQLLDRPVNQASRATIAITLLFGGILMVLLAGALLMDAEVRTTSTYLSQSIVMTSAFMMCGLLVLPLLGRGSWTQSLAGTCKQQDLALGISVGVVGWLLSDFYVLAMQAVFGSPEPQTSLFEPSLAAVLFTTVVLPSISEEWTDRGILWVALRRVAGVGVTIFCTAMVFAFMHGLNGAGLLELPHRFTLGLALGWLRMHTNSLWPCILAHASHNALAVLI